MSCVLRARGASFAVDEFLAASTLKPITIIRREQPQWPNSPPGSPIPNESGFHAIASEADFSNLQGQIADAVHYLEQNKNELVRLVLSKESRGSRWTLGLKSATSQLRASAFRPICCAF
jgi:hypothetical protein